MSGRCATTVRQVCAKYVEYLRSVKTARAANDVEARFRNYVLNDETCAAFDLSQLAVIVAEIRSAGQELAKPRLEQLRLAALCRYRIIACLLVRPALVDEDYLVADEERRPATAAIGQPA